MKDLTTDEAIDIVIDVCEALHASMEEALAEQAGLSAAEHLAIRLMASVKYLAAGIATASAMTGQDLEAGIAIAVKQLTEMSREMANDNQDGMQMH